ncbi:MAG: amidophosphoribosyltransferase [Bacillota bacterium]
MNKNTCAAPGPCHACGVFGVYGVNNPAEVCYLALYALQHRGQQGAGIAVSNEYGISYVKNTGLLTEVFHDTSVFESIAGGNAGIGHVRFCPEGGMHASNTQPFVVVHRTGRIAISLNGKILNADALRRELEDAGAIFQTSIDAEPIAYMIARNMGQCNDIGQAVEKAAKSLRGAFALTILTQTAVIGVRDPHGISPLCIGALDNGYCLASESCALDTIGARFLRDVQPGEIVIISETGMHSRKIHAPGGGLCAFEYVYFARPDSVIDSVSVHRARVNAGRALASVLPVEADMVTGVPDSAIPAALGYAEASGILYGIGLCKNRYIGRALIEPDQTVRSMNVSIKLNAMRASVEGKRIVLVDDSIVRGNTSKYIAGLLKRMGAREVHMRISSPPLVHSCPYGIDTHNEQQLICAAHGLDYVRNYIGVDSLAFIGIDALLESIHGENGASYCTGCFSGCYPIAGS